MALINRGAQFSHMRSDRALDSRHSSRNDRGAALLAAWLVALVVNGAG